MLLATVAALSLLTLIDPLIYHQWEVLSTAKIEESFSYYYSRPFFIAESRASKTVRQIAERGLRAAPFLILALSDNAETKRVYMDGHFACRRLKMCDCSIEILIEISGVNSWR